MTDRLTRQQLKEDPLLNKTADAANYMSTHVRLIVGAIVLVIAVGGVTTFMKSGRAKAEDRASALLVEARAQAKRGNLTAAESALEQMAEFMGGTRSGKEAQLLQGDVLYGLGKFQEAATVYAAAGKTFKGDPILSLAAQTGYAASLESTSQFAAAGDAYAALADKAPNSIVAAEFLMSAARNFLRADRREDAKRIYTDLSTHPENTRVAQEAQIRLAEMSASSAG